MHPPEPFPPPSGDGYASPARVAADLARQLARHGITGIYTAASKKFAVISVTAGLTVWTNGQLLWSAHNGQRYTWSASDIEAAAARLAVLAGPPGGS